MNAAEDCDVLVIGAGISGLNAARHLHAQGLRVVVLEARDRIAGRQWTYRDESVDYLDMGGAYVGKQQTAVLALLEELQLETYNLRTDQKSTLCFKSRRQNYKSGIPFFWNPLILLDLNNVLRVIDNLSKEVSLEAPWSHPRADEWDSLSVYDFIKSVTWTHAARILAIVGVEAPFISEAKDISLLYLLWAVHQCGGFEALVRIPEGLQEMKIVGGSGSISEKLYTMLPPEAVHLNTRVKEVRQQQDTAGSVVVTTHCNKSFKAQRVISTAALPGLMNMDFSPPLPPAMKQYAETEVACHAFKTFMCYETQFWREKGLNGELVSEDGIVSVCIDDSKPDGSRPAILGFIDSRKAKVYKSCTKEERQEMICEQYAREFGMEEFLSPVQYVEKDWGDEEETRLGRNCCVWSLPPKVLSKIKQLPDDHYGSVYFAGTEMAVTMGGYMDGAVRSSIHTVAKVLESLGHDVSTVMTPAVRKSSALIQEIPYLPSGWIERILPSVTQVIIGGLLGGSVITAAALATCMSL